MNRKPIKTWIKAFILILGYACLTGCSFTWSTNHSSCETQVTVSDQPIEQVNQVGINPVPCANNETLAVIQPDGNVYTYNICQKHLAQLTFDGQSYEGRSRQNGSYYFYDTSMTWSPNNEALLVGKGSIAQAINLQNGSRAIIGERVLSALWSPDSHKIALVQSPIGEYKNWEPAHSTISVINSQDFSNKLSFEGTAPVWISDSELIYFFMRKVTKAREILNEVNKVNMAGDHQTLCPRVNTIDSHVRYANLSTDKKYVATYSGVEPNLAVFSLDKLETFSVEWSVGSRRNVTRWSPTKSMLAICTAGEGGKDGPLPQTASGAVLLVEFNQPPQIFNVQRCLPWSQVSWDPSGEMVAFLNWDYKLTFIDTIVGEYMDGPAQPDQVKIDEGPWWSPSGHYISVISDNKVYVAQFNEKELQFEYVVDGVDISWQPLK